LAIAWNEDRPEDRALIESNIASVLREIALDASRRRLPTVVMAQDWHRQIYRGASLPVWYYAGEIRDSDPNYPELIGYEVMVGTAPGIPSQRVPNELFSFEVSIRLAVERLDALISRNARPADNDQLYAVLTLCAVSHGEWVRIHPFANGNGRVARLWANWCALRYGLPPFLRLKPRPEGDSYARAAALSMLGEHGAMVLELIAMLASHLER
jgi:fido (protein-threonine AMPylation protein)